MADFSTDAALHIGGQSVNRRKFLEAGASSSIALIAVPIFALELAFNEIYSLKCLGNVDGPRYLDGHTHDGTVALVRDLVKPFSGTKWQLVRAGNGTVAFRCRGNMEGPRWLDGRTNNGTVGLAPTTNAPFTGTRWQIVEVPGGVNLKCLGNIEGPRFLDGRTGSGSVGLAKTTDAPFTGTRWKLALYPHCFDEPCALP
jgi:hypothetical protein